MWFIRTVKSLNITSLSSSSVDPLEDVEKKLTKQNTEETDKKSTLSFSLSLSKEPKHLSPAPRQKSSDTVDESQSTNNNNGTPYHPVGSFVLLKQFSLIGQIGSLAVCTTVEGLNQLIVSQPNGGYCILGQYDEEGFTENIVCLSLLSSNLRSFISLICRKMVIPWIHLLSVQNSRGVSGFSRLLKRVLTEHGALSWCNLKWFCALWPNLFSKIRSFWLQTNQFFESSCLHF